MAEDAVGDFARAMADSGLPCDRPIIADGRIHRYRARNGKRENEYYVLYQNGVAAGAYGSHRTGEKYNWREQRHTFQTFAERSAFKRQIAEAQRLRDEAIAQAQAKAAERARRMLTRSREADPKHPYLIAKGITPHCAKQIGRMLVLPIRDIASGVIVNLQFILERGVVRMPVERLARPDPGRPHDRDAGRFGVTRWHINEQPLDLASRDSLKVFSDQIDVPVLKVDRRRLDHVPSFFDVKPEIIAQDNSLAIEVGPCPG